MISSAEQQEIYILQNIVGIVSSQINNTKSVSVVYPGKVRLLKVEQISLEKETRMLSERISGYF